MFYNNELNKEAAEAAGSGRLGSFGEWWLEYQKIQTTTEDYAVAKDAWTAAVNATLYEGD